MDELTPIRTGAIVIADGHGNSPGARAALLPFGETTMIRQILNVLEHAMVKPIILITGEDFELLEKQISKFPVIRLYNPNYQKDKMLDSVLIGMKYAEGLCDRVLILPAKYPMLLSDTIERMISCGHDNVVPVFGGRRGHPVMLSSKLFTMLYMYKGNEGLRGALREPQISGQIYELPVEDDGIIFPVESKEDRDEIPDPAKPLRVYPEVQLSLKKESVFWNYETSVFLELIEHNGSMRTACIQMHMSYSKGWNIIKEAERQLGYELLNTRSGGADGGASKLTEKGKHLLERYRRIQEKLQFMAKQLFEEKS
ncbi:NTP transferase domain-containing protein [Blautia liquoris]|uniref:NTP transferase domain-containing protein n=1 Tax=Blautia liquoris TaxID=2779518 RepID=A0A7M2RJE9_9FIRM|nr:NTP transferase domain-containing protein [Blautia liquoris]QOV20443.1 NTP transferase domain-containing protein [Blautia liquoris]